MTPEEVKKRIENSENRTRTYLGTESKRRHNNDEKQVGVRDENRVLNVMNLGPIGHGKTQMMVHAALQDIHKGRGICFITPKGDAVNQILRKMPEDRLDDVIYLNPNREPVTKINVLEPNIEEGMTEAEMENQREIIVSDVVDMVKRRSIEWGDRFGRVFKTILRANINLNLWYNESRTLVDVYDAVVEEDELLELIDRTDDRYIRNQLVRIRDRLTQRELDPLQQRLDDFVQTRTVERVIDARRSQVDFQEVVNDGKILLVDVQKGEIGDDPAGIIGSIVLTQVWAAVQSRVALPEEERNPFYLYVDEVHNFATESSNFAKILAESREYGMGAWLASQHLRQLEPEMRESLNNHCRTKIFFNPGGSDELNKITRMLRGVEKRKLTALGKYRAVIQQPGDGEYGPAVTFDTYPPWNGSRDEQAVERIKLEATVAHEEEAGEKQRRHVVNDSGRGGNSGDYEHSRLLRSAKEYLERREEVEYVDVIRQEPGVEDTDAEIIKTDGSVANLEAEVSTLEKPGRVLTNLKRAVDQDRKCVFVVHEENAAMVQNIVSDPVNRRGQTREDEDGSFDYYQLGDGEEFTEVDTVRDADYRILAVTSQGSVYDYGRTRDAECPQLDEYTEEELVAECLLREPDGFCNALEQPCVLLEEP